IEGEIPIRDRLVMIQVESLGYNLMEFRADGKEVTPFLNALKERSLLYRIRAIHYNGSADSDFSALNGVEPSLEAITYNIPNYPYDDSLPKFLAQRGFHSRAIHGYAGNFYNRRLAYQQMGFDQLCFREEILRERSFPTVDGALKDRDVLRFASERIQATKGKTFDFIITFTGHFPFSGLQPEERKLYPEPTQLGEKYLNCMHYVDECLKEFTTSLPSSTTVVIYGDHTISATTFQPDREGDEEFVPCLIYNVGEDLAALQKSRGSPLAEAGNLSIIDVSNLAKNRIRRQSAAVPAIVSESTRP
ncbi:MAG: LTA synthase family protein, partial [Planctomycetales bacterium]